MDIFILSDGKEIGPFSEETAQTLINQGTIAATDLAWTSGMEDWAPLAEMLPSSEKSDSSDLSDLSDPSEKALAASKAPSPAEAKPQIELATAKQKAFLGYLAISFPEDLSKEQASALLNDAVGNPAFAEQIGRWSAERLRLHPDLFAAEVHARKADRANHFFEICQTEGAQYFTRITKAHCQVLVAFLDVKFPKWDARMEDAATNYFFPAIAEKFPQLIERHWKDRFHYAEEPGTKSVRKTPAARVRKSPVTPLEAVVRGFALGAAVLAALYFGQRMIPGWMGRRSAEVASAQRPSLVKSSSNLVLTKPVELQFASGKVTLPVGTAVKLVSRDGASLKVNYLNTVIVVPASSTDIDSAIPESGASSSGSPPSATPAPTHSGES